LYIHYVLTLYSNFEKSAEQVLASLVVPLTSASRMGESSSWRYPVDLVNILDDAFNQLPAALEAGSGRRSSLNADDELTNILLGDNPQAVVNVLLNALHSGATEEQLALAVSYAAALRVVRFNTNNDFGDWDTAHHPFTYANAVHQGLQRVLH
jgi:hypothetical protein